MQTIKFWFALSLLVVMAVGVVAGFLFTLIHGIMTIVGAL